MSTGESKGGGIRSTPGSSAHADHAIVIGAGIAGLAMAKALTAGFGRVSILDGDRVGAGNRRGASSSCHPPTATSNSPRSRSPASSLQPPRAPRQRHGLSLVPARRTPPQATRLPRPGLHRPSAPARRRSALTGGRPARDTSGPARRRCGPPAARAPLEEASPCHRPVRCRRTPRRAAVPAPPAAPPSIASSVSPRRGSPPHCSTPETAPRVPRCEFGPITIRPSRLQPMPGLTVAELA
jgi:hypothetical protein